MVRTLLRYRKKSRRVRPLTVSVRSSLACPQQGRSQNSFPCSRARELKLQDCFFQVCVYALLLLPNRLSCCELMPKHHRSSSAWLKANSKDFDTDYTDRTDVYSQKLWY